MASIISSLATSFLEIDEVGVTKKGNIVTYTFLTTGILPSIAELKTKLWALVAPPMKRLEVVSITPVEEGYIAKRYKVVVKGTTVRSAIKSGKRIVKFSKPFLKSLKKFQTKRKKKRKKRK